MVPFVLEFAPKFRKFPAADSKFSPKFPRLRRAAWKNAAFVAFLSMSFENLANEQKKAQEGGVSLLPAAGGEKFSGVCCPPAAGILQNFSTNTNFSTNWAHPPPEIIIN